jgi:predicted negative regulator of RcsB-dependent stress response
MPTAPPPSRNPTVDAQVFWLRFRNEIIAAAAILLLALGGFIGYRIYVDRQASAASALLSSARTVEDYKRVIANYPNTPAGASAYLLLAEAQRSEKKFAEANTTLETFVDKHPEHELVPSARMAMAANLESMGKTDEALSIYGQIAAKYPKNFNAPLALVSAVPLLKAKHRDEEARQMCERVMTDYRESFWANMAEQQLHSLKPRAASQPPPGPTAPPMLAAPRPTAPIPRPTTAPPKKPHR